MRICIHALMDHARGERVECARSKTPKHAMLYKVRAQRSAPGRETVSKIYGSRPNTATLSGVPIYTLPLATMGVMNLFPLKLSRPLAA